MRETNTGFSVRDISAEERSHVQLILGRDGVPVWPWTGSVLKTYAAPMFERSFAVRKYLEKLLEFTTNGMPNTTEREKTLAGFYRGALLYAATYAHINRTADFRVHQPVVETAIEDLRYCDPDFILDNAREAVSDEAANFLRMVDWLSPAVKDRESHLLSVAGAGILHVIMSDSERILHKKRPQASALDTGEEAVLEALETDPDLADLQRMFDNEGFHS